MGYASPNSGGEIYKARMEAEGYKGNVKPWLRRAVFF